MKITELAPKPKEKKLTRVAAYARVSVDKDAAFHSLDAQINYYTEYIAQHEDWELVEIYSDNGISGTIVNRPEFSRMIEDCRKHKIDLVITKSITRFARNTVVLLETIRELKSLGIDVFFEKEHMHSISPDGELMLTLLAIYAEEEARSVSENQKWRIRKRFEQGEPWVGNMLGYRLINGKMVVVPEEAEIVRMIFNDYLDGKGAQAIARKLNDMGVPAARSDCWHQHVIHKIICNEKYMGDMLLQKTYRPDFRTKYSIPNNGKERKYYIADNHEAIIDRATFSAVQKELKRRRKEHSPVCNKHTKLFTGMITCGLCGNLYRERIANSTSRPKSVWICGTFFELGKQMCPSQQIPEDILIAKTKEVLEVNELDRDTMLEKINSIEATGHFHLRYELKDGTVQYIVWEHKSRSKSWTPEMKEAARQKALEYHRKKEEKEKSEEAKGGKE